MRNSNEFIVDKGMPCYDCNCKKRIKTPREYNVYRDRDAIKEGLKNGVKEFVAIGEEAVGYVYFRNMLILISAWVSRILLYGLFIWLMISIRPYVQGKGVIEAATSGYYLWLFIGAELVVMLFMLLSHDIKNKFYARIEPFLKDGKELKIIKVII